ncbi:MAG: tetratricopeptide repeat protein [Bacteroidota bacterium]
MIIPTFLSFMLFGLLVELPAAVATGDEAFSRIEYSAAISFYETALTSMPDNPEILWRLARVYVCLGEVEEGPQGVEFLRKAEMYGRRCLQGDSTNAVAHTWLAGALGYLALNANAGEQVRLSHELLEHVDRALALDPKNDAAYSIKGSFYRALGNVGWLERRLATLFVGSIPDGGYEEAEAALLHAITLAPDVMRHRYELGVLYIDWGRKEEALQALRKAATLPVRVAIDRPRLEKIHALLSEIEASP